MARIDKSGLIVAANPAFRCFVGKPEAEWLGAGWAAALLRSDAVAEAEALPGSGWIGIGERRFPLDDGRWVGLCVSVADEGYWVAFHDATAREALEEAVDHRRRAESIAELAGSVARELNDPMSIVLGRLELLLALGPRADAAAVARHAAVALEHTRRVTASLRNLRLVGRSVARRAEPVDMGDAIAEALVLLGPRAGLVHATVPDGTATGGDPAVIARLLATQLRRALDGSPRGVTVEVRRTRDAVEVEITAAPGERRGRVELDPEVGEIALLAGAGGRVEQSPDGPGCALILPLPPVTRARARRVEGRVIAVGHPDLAVALEGVISREGFEVTAAASPADALAALEADTTVLGLACDLFLGSTSGLAFAAEVARRHPAVSGRILLVSEVGIANPPAGVRVVHPPLRRGPVLEALGRRVRRP
jgi:hypothetical protein